jgi:pyridoxal phosphate enzyme (YggS family)
VADVAERLAAVRQRVAAAAVRANRDPASVTLIGATKSVDAGRIAEALAAGLADFGENWVQEALPKIAAVGPGPRWHFIGHLQRNKARAVAGAFEVVHSLDRLRVAEALGRAAARLDRRVKVLVEVNIAEEPTKFGVAPGAVEELIVALERLDHLEAVGLMTIGPVVDVPDAMRPYFRRLRALRDRLRAGPAGPGFAELSMGMSGDFEVAIEEGATMVRVGRAIFGER